MSAIIRGKVWVRYFQFYPYFKYQWHMTQINMESAWDLSTGEGTTVAVIDTGVRQSLEDLQVRHYVGDGSWCRRDQPESWGECRLTFHVNDVIVFLIYEPDFNNEVEDSISN